MVDVMRDNVNKVLERDVKLGELDARAENLEVSHLKCKKVGLPGKLILS